MRWALRDGTSSEHVKTSSEQVDYYGLRFLEDGDKAFVIEVDEAGRSRCWKAVFRLRDGTFREHVDDFEDHLSCCVMACLQFDQGFIEYAVWFDATDRWSCMSSAFGSAVKSIDPEEGES